MGFCYERQIIINYRLTVYMIMSACSKQYKGKQGKRGWMVPRREEVVILYRLVREDLIKKILFV